MAEKHKRKRSRRKQRGVYKCYEPRAAGNGKARLKPHERELKENIEALKVFNAALMKFLDRDAEK